MQNAVDQQTLADAIEQLRRLEDPNGETTAAMSRDTAAAFDMHDAVHVLFRCGTSLEDEIAAHVWMKFATTANIRDMHRAVANQEHRKVLAGLGHGTVARTWLRMLPRILTIIARSRRMTRPIAFDQLEQLKQRSVAQIRAEHGIPGAA
jgi:hypothetical protein